MPNEEKFNGISFGIRQSAFGTSQSVLAGAADPRRSKYKARHIHPPPPNFLISVPARHSCGL
jgi:hypothetical protein